MSKKTGDFSGNKGEWSEVYVFLKLLADGKLCAADANLDVLPNVYYPIIKILRQECDQAREYRINGNIKIVDGVTDVEIVNLPVSDFIAYSQSLFHQLKKQTKGKGLKFGDIETFLRSIDVRTLKATKADKADIKIVVHDLNTGLEPQLGFSIKSMLGKNATLFNSGKTTNFIYEIIGGQTLDIAKINAIDTEPKIASRIAKIRENGCKIVFKSIQSEMLKLNLQLIDGDLPLILSELLLIKYSNKGLALLRDILAKLTQKNPLGFDLTKGHPFYEHKIKNFLTDSALGMTPSCVWTGQYDANGGIIIVKKSGDLVCYHIYNRNEFQTYLFNNTRLEQASTSENRSQFGDLYEENRRIYLKLNLQIRFAT